MADCDVVAGVLGLEPRLVVLETIVLTIDTIPLHYLYILTYIFKICKKNINNKI